MIMTLTRSTTRDGSAGNEKSEYLLYVKKETVAAVSFFGFLQLLAYTLSNFVELCRTKVLEIKEKTGIASGFVLYC